MGEEESGWGVEVVSGEPEVAIHVAGEFGADAVVFRRRIWREALRWRRTWLSPILNGRGQNNSYFR